MLPCDPQPADAERGVGFVGQAQERQRLVGAGVEGAHDDLAAGQRGEDVAVRGDLLFVRRRVAAVEVEELGAEQADAFDLAAAPARSRGRADVGQ